MRLILETAVMAAIFSLIGTLVVGLAAYLLLDGLLGYRMGQDFYQGFAWGGIALGVFIGVLFRHKIKAWTKWGEK